MSPRVAGVVLFGLAASAASAQNSSLEFEAGSFWQTRNTAAVPANATKFSYRDLLGRGPFPVTRTTLTLNPEAASGYRLVWAPVRVSGSGTLDRDVVFDGRTFTAATPTSGEYMFNSYRATWWKRWRGVGRAQARAGYTLFVRDARISLAQGNNRASFYNLGVVPLAYVGIRQEITPRLSGELDFDGFLSPYGGALDTGLALAYHVDRQSDLKLKVRTLDGGTSRGQAYNFATLISVTLGFERRW